MIGVVMDAADEDVVCEFFELFKTPWEFYRSGRSYEVLLCESLRGFTGTAKLVVLYSGKRTCMDDERGIQTERPQRGRKLVYRTDPVPIYGDAITFPSQCRALMTEEESGHCAGYLEHHGEQTIARIGYHLFAEIRRLLEDGQPLECSAIPTLELHIAFLRDLITSCGIGLTEIPPVPEGYKFIACLTHDVDHPSIRRHGWDHTTIGFLYRAVFGSLGHLLRRRISFRCAVRNWAAAFNLPFIHLGLAKDFWLEFGRQYSRIEDGVPSTYFVIPFENRPGIHVNHGTAPKYRAARYDVRSIAHEIRELAAGGCEIGLHGIDAWIDSSKGREELEQVRRVSGTSQIGVRMHWLYFNRQSPRVLEDAGVSYDSTVGYNETVGYRAGTTQVFKPLRAAYLLELPLHAMDTALFYPSHMGLSGRDAKAVLSRMIDNAVEFGGCLTINWHDRSVLPERLWDACYRDVIRELRERGAWFATAGQAVSWFRKRRAMSFDTNGAATSDGISAPRSTLTKFTSRNSDPL